MKYWLIFFYFGQAFSPKGTGYEAPPYFYANSFNSYKEADEARIKLNDIDKTGQGTIIYGYTEMEDMNFKDRGNK